MRSAIFLGLAMVAIAIKGELTYYQALVVASFFCGFLAMDVIELIKRLK